MGRAQERRRQAVPSTGLGEGALVGLGDLDVVESVQRHCGRGMADSQSRAGGGRQGEVSCGQSNARRPERG